MKSLLFLALLVGVLVLVSGKEKAEHVKESHYTEDGEHNDAYDHQSILGSKEEEEEFANLSPAEAKKRLALMFEKMDSNQDTFVSKDEIVAWILRSYIQMDVDEAKTSVEEYDTNKDGKVTWSEYINKLQGDASESSDSEEMKETVEADKLKFDAADVDKDGALSLNEYAAFMYPYDFKHMHQVEIEMTLRQMDNDKDGTINFNEFTGEVPTTDEKDQLANKENFAEFDKDKDGKLDKKEMEAWIVPSSDESAIDEAGHLIDETDTDSDGKLSKEEVLAKHDLWVGSSATAYGKGLHDEL